MQQFDPLAMHVFSFGGQDYIGFHTFMALAPAYQMTAELPKDYQAILEAACGLANVDMMAKYDAVNPAALRRLVAAGVQLRPFPREIMQASYKAAVEVYGGFAETNPKFKKIYEPWKKFRDEEILWFRVAEQNFDQFMATASQQSTAKKA